MLEEKLLELKGGLIGYAALVEGMIVKSIRGLLNKDLSLLREIIYEDEKKANNFEIEFDELCTSLIAQYEPKAGDLRAILMASKMTNDIERMGDHAVNISESSIFLIEKPLVKPLVDIPRMADITTSMLKDSMEAFINEDVSLAKSVCERDNSVDELKDQILRELITYMVSDTTTIERALHLLRISGNLERIADLSTNICEDVIFIVEGKVIKHNIEQ